MSKEIAAEVVAEPLDSINVKMIIDLAALVTHSQAWTRKVISNVRRELWISFMMEPGHFTHNANSDARREGVRNCKSYTGKAGRNRGGMLARFGLVFEDDPES
ncbi:MAG: hypothetical protein FJ333_08455 [Sphingomonadales bacterium]|nr:hypothetical protein [Sphingomonadales bacterium]